MEGRSFDHSTFYRYRCRELSNHYIVMVVQRSAYNDADANLTYDFEATFQSILILAEYFDVIIQETYQSQPNGSDQQELNVDIVEVGK